MSPNVPRTPTQAAVLVVGMLLTTLLLFMLLGELTAVAKIHGRLVQRRDRAGPRVAQLSSHPRKP
jgi:hypothetical protein